VHAQRPRTPDSHVDAGEPNASAGPLACTGQSTAAGPPAAPQPGQAQAKILADEPDGRGPRSDCPTWQICARTKVTTEREHPQLFGVRWVLDMNDKAELSIANVVQ